jgi:hypothetical protein
MPRELIESSVYFRARFEIVECFENFCAYFFPPESIENIRAWGNDAISVHHNCFPSKPPSTRFAEWAGDHTQVISRIDVYFHYDVPTDIDDYEQVRRGTAGWPKEAMAIAGT